MNRRRPHWLELVLIGMSLIAASTLRWEQANAYLILATYLAIVRRADL